MKHANLLILLFIFLTINASGCDRDNIVKLSRFEIKDDSSNLLQILKTIANYKANYCADTSRYYEIQILVTNEKYQDAFKGKRMVQIKGINTLSEKLKYCSGYVEINENYFLIYNGSGKGIEELGNIFTTTGFDKVFKTIKTISDDSVFLDDDSIECISCQLYFKDGKFFFFEDEEGNLCVKAPPEYPGCYNNEGALDLFIKNKTSN